MRTEELNDIMRDGEGQTVEFKTSFAEEKEAIQSLVAFANAQGGRVFIGVKDDGTAVGVDTGENTLENLAAAIRDHTYPSLPVFLERCDHGGNEILVAEAAADTPPVIGVYLYGSDPIPLDKPVEADRLQAYRRVGRANLKEDFMRLRAAQPSDPKLRVTGWDTYLNGREPGFEAIVWAEGGSATAHDVEFRLVPPLCESSTGYADFPGPSEERTELPSSTPRLQRWRTDYVLAGVSRVRFTCHGVLDEAPRSIRLAARYKDDWGLTWESSRRLELLVREQNGEQAPDLADAGEFRRRIVRFPPKS